MDPQDVAHVQQQIVHVVREMDTALDQLSSEQVANHIQVALGYLQVEVDTLLEQTRHLLHHPEDFSMVEDDPLMQERLEQFLRLGQEALEEIQDGLKDVHEDEIALLAQVGLSTARGMMRVSTDSSLLFLNE